VTVYSINDLEQLSGIKAHTLRIWEQRYAVITPQRTATNIRYYTDKDLRKVLNISLLNKHGYKISKIAQMPEAEILDAIENIAKQPDGDDTRIDTLAMAMVEMDELRFEQIVGKSIKSNGFEKTLQDLIFPFLDKINLLYLTGSIKPAQEHFITNLIRQKIIAAIDAIPFSEHLDTSKFLIFLPDGERQELSLIYMHYVLKSRGIYVINLGFNLSVEDVVVAYDVHRPAYIYTMFNEPHKHAIQRRIDDYAAAFPTSTVLYSGYQMLTNYVTLPKNALVLRNLNETLMYLQGLHES
jgi:MerR family transcriptional regulator, light-induced transcriptional regulator